MKLYQVTTPWMCAGMEVERGRVTRAAPILRWAVGKELSYLGAWCKRKRYSLRLVRP